MMAQMKDEKGSIPIKRTKEQPKIKDNEEKILWKL